MNETDCSFDGFETHQVFNQSPVFGGHNAYADDPVLQGICFELSASVKSELNLHGAWAGSVEAQEQARLANRYVPVLKTFDSKGHRIDQVEVHPSWHSLLSRSIGLGMHASCWQELPEEAGQIFLARAARYYLTAEVEMGHLCPITMTNACVAALAKSPAIANEWLPRITNRTYDPYNKPAKQKTQVLLGMGMTEKQGGTDVRTNSTYAKSMGDGWWKIVGHKWFMSVPQSDAFLILAQSAEGLGCFLVPRLLEEGSNNNLRFQRLKDKLGNRSNASSEVELKGSLGQLVGPSGQGIQTIIEMVTLTRLDCAVASAGLMRVALWEAIEHCKHRSVLGQFLLQQPIMRCVLADMTLDMLAATALAFRLSRAFDRANQNIQESVYCRLMTPVTKYWNCKLAPSLIYEAMECLGGNGYVEDGNLARHYREAPLNAIWEGSGNVMCLDVLRVLSKQPDSLDIVLDLLDHKNLCFESPLANTTGREIDRLRLLVRQTRNDPMAARAATELLAYLAATCELQRLGLHATAEAFATTRLAGNWRSTYGMLDRKYVDIVLSTAFH